MPREHWNDVPGDLAGSSAADLPAGFGVDDPDADVDATVDELVGGDVRSPTGQRFVRREQRGGISAGAGRTAPGSDGASVDQADLLEGNEEHPGAAIGFTGAEEDKGGRPK